MSILNNISLKPYNTFGIDVMAEQFAGFESQAELVYILEQAKTTTPTLVLGGGSNILLTKDVQGLVLKNEIKGIKILEETDDYVLVQAGAGEIWHPFVRKCIEKNYSGIENLSLIPGCVGASPMQNIGAYGVEIKDIFYSLDAYHLQDKRVDTIKKEDCNFGYRESAFKRKWKGEYIILNVTYKLSKHPQFHVEYGAIKEELEKMQIDNLSIKAISDAIINIRSSKLPDPKIIGNAGSFFKNPTIEKTQFEKLKSVFPHIKGFTIEGNIDKIKVAAGWLIEQAGWKGFREKDYGVHKNQALVLVNYGSATGAQVFDLSTRIIHSIEDKFGITLEREVNIL
ncbi:UDP-N-acetylmuramate dehydrogenase [Rhizosphaericola mali]|uniref:UDP-N-acetylenolpyruvoylglucosamine reductase n=1 Tax=Rhizosphaericola mali TaxID=2545455 RepID=A0A5P2G0M5_9BACT|nr:UDP-N-acetylmuramate dehydrogenase [Rhizosphaericola mali]QES88985.1 UDP-N-acetylmuramate dehydrogenase [Rhizosphaericola mali]